MSTRFYHIQPNLIYKIINQLGLQGDFPRGNPLQKQAYATVRDEHTVFFSKRRKNSSLCAHHMAALILQALQVDSYPCVAILDLSLSLMWEFTVTIQKRLHNSPTPLFSLFSPSPSNKISKTLVSDRNTTLRMTIRSNGMKKPRGFYKWYQMQKQLSLIYNNLFVQSSAETSFWL